MRVREYSSKGIAFDKNLHIPETSSITGSIICQREDEGHIFKVCCTVRLWDYPYFTLTCTANCQLSTAGSCQ